MLNGFQTTSDHNHVCDVSLVGLTCKLGSSRTVIAHTLRLFKLSRPRRQRISTNFPLRSLRHHVLKGIRWTGGVHRRSGEIFVFLQCSSLRETLMVGRLRRPRANRHGDSERLRETRTQCDPALCPAKDLAFLGDDFVLLVSGSQPCIRRACLVRQWIHAHASVPEVSGQFSGIFYVKMDLGF